VHTSPVPFARGRKQHAIANGKMEDKKRERETHQGQKHLNQIK